MQGLSWIDDLKIRGGWGIMGNSNNVDPNNQYFLYATGVGPASYPIDNSTAAEGYYGTTWKLCSKMGESDYHEHRF